MQPASVAATRLMAAGCTWQEVRKGCHHQKGLQKPAARSNAEQQLQHVRSFGGAGTSMQPAPTARMRMPRAGPLSISVPLCDYPQVNDDDTMACGLLANA